MVTGQFPPAALNESSATETVDLRMLAMAAVEI